MACPNFKEKTFIGGSKATKFVNVFSLKSFPLYGVRDLVSISKSASAMPRRVGD